MEFSTGVAAAVGMPVGSLIDSSCCEFEGMIALHPAFGVVVEGVSGSGAETGVLCGAGERRDTALETCKGEGVAGPVAGAAATAKGEGARNWFLVGVGGNGEGGTGVRGGSGEAFDVVLDSEDGVVADGVAGGVWRDPAESLSRLGSRVRS